MTEPLLRRLPSVLVITSATPEQLPNGKIEERFPSIVRAVLRKPVQPEQLRTCVTQYLR